MPLTAPDLGIDLGTSNTALYVSGRGIVISEPTVVVVERDNHRTVRAVGDEARFLYGRSPEKLIADAEAGCMGMTILLLVIGIGGVVALVRALF